MSIEKIASKSACVRPSRRRDSRLDGRTEVPAQQMDFLSLQIEDDAGGDPYNRTGQHCLAEIKSREK
jgi:hypothetical protein